MTMTKVLTISTRRLMLATLLFACGAEDEQTGRVAFTLDGACVHDQCTPGEPLDGVCNPAAASICAVDPYCCQISWDSICVDEVRIVANNLVCTASQGSCQHTLCSTGAALVSGCDFPLGSSCVANICAVDPYCCQGSWDRICVGEVESVCGKSCDDSGCDLDGDGDPTPACGGSDANDTCTGTSGDLQLTECATDLIGLMNGLIGTINTIQVPFAARTEADVTLTCPSNTGVGEARPNIFSNVGALPKSCNRMVPDDCADPARSNYWVSVTDNRRPENYHQDPHYFGVIWGAEHENYDFYGACSPDPHGFDNAAAGIPKLLQPVNDVDGNGSVGEPPRRPGGPRVCSGQNHVFGLRFYVPDWNGGRIYIDRGDIAQISSPFLAPSWLPLPDVTSADHAVINNSAYVAVDLTLKQSGQVVTAFIDNNYNPGVWMQWKEPVSCGIP